MNPTFTLASANYPSQELRGIQPMVSFAWKHVVRVWNAQPIREAMGCCEVLQARRTWHVPSARYQYLTGWPPGCRVLLRVIPWHYSNIPPMVPFHGHVCNQ